MFVRPVGVGLGAGAAALVGVPAEVAHEMLAGVGDVLGELGDEVQCVEDLEVAGDPRTAAEQARARRPVSYR